MPKSATLGYEQFEEWERKMAKRKAERLVWRDRLRSPRQRAGFTPSDIPDLEQEMLLQIWIKRGRYKPEHEKGASLESFISFALDKFSSDLRRSRRRQKRAGEIRIDSLDREIEDEEGDASTLADMIADERPAEQPASSSASLRLDVERALGGLAEPQRTIGRRIMEGRGMEEIGTEFGISRMTLYREIQRMRRVLYEAGLGDYLADTSGRDTA